ncbi:glycosyltransferase family 1 protein [Hafnia paralvei]|uniref:glycosyltransferase family 4 protein n=1 Tax=Hafnia paralvei TaxID=546367 RepID=UPI000DF27BA4|nr:glycosyltransferase family 4 protein [Hafnia paralvei]MBU2673996.1 glycosyltransferase family 4 protein [Hafnia paralvei]RDA70563.1 glycosyltransferase family 1 protein [Hafnia paralvei]RDA71398.1 glycosyltransferase family 1 protein [Hafnia paralvei]RDA71450.1 glycosyltransferase family 1 protein [Hafnia paralvei]RDA80635.1 glycosyltransferase family 1 protein [Hafnia paralvei]
MTVIFSANTTWYLYNFRLNTIKKFLSLGFNVHIVAPKDKYTRLLQGIGCECHHLFLRSNSLDPFSDAVTIFNLAVLYVKIKPSYIYNFTPKLNIYGAISARVLKKTKVINNIAGLGTGFVEDSIKQSLLKVMYKVSQKKVDIIFFQNDEDMDLFLSQRIVSEGQCERIPGSGVDLARFTILQDYPKKNEDLKFLLVARLIEHKGIELYANAANIVKKKWPKVHFDLLGPFVKNNPAGVSEAKIANWEADGIIKYLGESDDVHSVIKEYDCVVLPSFYREGVPKSLLEAAASGKIIITTDNVGCRETVIDGISGYLCEPRSLSSLVEAIIMVLNLSEDQRNEMKKRARVHAEEKFDESIVIDKYVKTIDI